MGSVPKRSILRTSSSAQGFLDLAQNEAIRQIEAPSTWWLVEHYRSFAKRFWRHQTGNARGASRADKKLQATSIAARQCWKSKRVLLRDLKSVKSHTDGCPHFDRGLRLS